MRKYVVGLLCLIAIHSCSERKVIETPKEGVQKILAVYIRPDSSKVVDALVRQIFKTIKYDSVSKKDIIVIDTVWAYPSFAALRDSANNVVRDSLGHVKYGEQVYYFPVGKDSVTWKIENISFDSLIKK